LFQCFVARQKLDIPAGKKLVLEENGNEIDEDDVLLLMLEERRILLLLCNGERWRPDGGTRPTCLTVLIPALTGITFLVMSVLLFVCKKTKNFGDRFERNFRVDRLRNRFKILNVRPRPFPERGQSKSGHACEWPTEGQF